MRLFTLILSSCLAVALTGCPMAAHSSAPAVSTVTEAERSKRETEATEVAPPAVESPATSTDDQLAATEPAKEDKLAEKPAAKPDTKPNDAGPSTRPKADRTPRKPGEPIRITFDHIILGMQADVPFRPWMLNDDVKALEGEKVSITGVIYGKGLLSTKPLKDFILLRNAECKFGPGGQADHLAKVELKKGEAINYSNDTVRVEGILRIKPETGEDGNTWSLYILEDATAKVQK